ncbi:DUF4132 domain-containing protein [Nocardiopsis sp. EMB25]|uniref:DUF4132 domain-containing protein n=1 Tax=Nocardiopsis sp. EMB25 TaxID=2835867 RepID=UPI0022837B7D|nr:DUF4132 domain-containing protein [Nocardiopsis sp. EMB25]MCY9784038.1 DUF4132 domain-containing protein [Nocardiopsis sp. EMB25]
MNVTAPEARAWADRMAEEYDLLPEAADLAADLFTPALPGLVAEFEREVAALPDGAPLLSWGVRSRKPESRLDELLERLDTDDVARLVVWSNASLAPVSPAGGDTARARDPRQNHHGVRRHFEKHPQVWSTSTLPLLLRSVPLGASSPDLAVRACQAADPATLRAVADDVHAMAARIAARFSNDPHEHWSRERTHHELLALLLDLGRPLGPADEVLGYRDDRFLNLLHTTHPDITSSPAVTALFVHGLRPLKGPDWESALPAYLDAVPDVDDVLRRVLEPLLELPDVDGEHGQAGVGGRRGHPRHTIHLTVHATVLVKGVLRVLTTRPAAAVPWAVDLLEELITRLWPLGHRVHSLVWGHEGLSSTLSSLRAGSAIPALTRIGTDIRTTPDTRAQRAEIEKALRGAGHRQRLSDVQLADRSVPDFGLDRDGTLTRRLGQHTLTLTATADGAALTFTEPGGTIAKRAPRALREDHPDQLRKVQELAKLVRTELKAQRARLGGLRDARHEWELPDWLPHLVDHPLTGLVSRELEWEVTTDGLAWNTGALAADGAHWRLVSPDGGTLLYTGTAAPRARVRLAPRSAQP